MSRAGERLACERVGERGRIERMLTSYRAGFRNQATLQTAGCGLALAWLSLFEADDHTSPRLHPLSASGRSASVRSFQSSTSQDARGISRYGLDSHDIAAPTSACRAISKISRSSSSPSAAACPSDSARFSPRPGPSPSFVLDGKDGASASSPAMLPSSLLSLTPPASASAAGPAPPPLAVANEFDDEPLPAGGVRLSPPLEAGCGGSGLSLHV